MLCRTPYLQCYSESTRWQPACSRALGHQRSFFEAADWLSWTPSIEIVALCLGNGGNSKDRDLDRELPFIFQETLGAWAAKEREHAVPRMYRMTGSDSESGSDGEEEDDT